MSKGRTLILAAFLCPLIAGLVFMAFAGTPASFLLTNAAAALCVAIAFWRAPQINLLSSLLTVTIVIPVLFVGTFAGPAAENVHRWIALGPLKLHVAMLVLPLFATQMYRHDQRIIAAASALLALVVALQPDRASALALFLTALCWFYFVPSRWSLTTLFVSVGALVRTLLTADTLPPVRFVEDVIGDAALAHPGIAVVLFVTMLAAIAGPLCVGWRGRFGPVAPRFSWSACLIGYFLASLAGPFPVPLLGYGVSSIFGFGLSLALLDHQKDAAT
jgi:cell division protein FtsW (lipid II flippase)